MCDKMDILEERKQESVETVDEEILLDHAEDVNSKNQESYIEPLVEVTEEDGTIKTEESSDHEQNNLALDTQAEDSSSPDDSSGVPCDDINPSSPVGHILIINNRIVHKCKLCNFKSKSKQNVLVHTRKHTGEKPHKCSYCDYRCSRLYNLSRHLKTHTGGNPYRCIRCNFATSDKNSLEEHMCSNTDGKPYKCSECNYETSKKYHFDIHVRTHTGEKPLKCSYCDYRCSQKSNLVVHIRTHTKEKPHKCNICDHSFSNRRSWVTHVRTHSVVKTFKCSFCAAEYPDQSSLTQHLRIHINLNKCSHCQYGSYCKKTFNDHTQTHTEEERFKCS